MFAHNPKVQDAIRLRSCHANLALPTLPGFRLMLKSTVQSTSFHCLLLFFSFNVELLLPFAQYKKYFPPTDVYHTTPTLFIEHFQHGHSRHEGLYTNTTKDVQSTHSLGLVSVLQCCIFLLAYETLADTEGLLNPASSWPKGKTFIKD